MYVIILSMEDNTWAFLRAPRFWAIVIAAVALALYQDGIISLAWVTAVTTITGGYTAVRTLDRMSDKKVEAAEVAGNTITFNRG